MTQYQDLPRNWIVTSLGELCLPVETTSPLGTPNESFTYIDIAAIDNSSLRVLRPKVLLGRDAPSRARQMVTSHNILISTVRTYLKNIALVPQNLDGSIASTGFCVLNPTREVNSKLIFYYVQTDEFIARLNRLQRGTSYPAVRDDDVLPIQQIPLPPQSEQHRSSPRLRRSFRD